MNKLTNETRAQVLSMLCEGMGINATCRVTGVAKMTVLKLLADAGAACEKFHDENVRNVKSKKIQCDEIWSFCYAKEKNVPAAVAAPEEAGDVWTWTALDADSKLIVSYLVGGRDAGYATEFMQDVAGRLANRVQLTTDGHKAYLNAVEDAFAGDVDFAQLIKLYGAVPESQQRRYSPAPCTGSLKRRVNGNPNPEHVSTSHVERQNLTMRMHMRRFTRLTNAFSKKIENHVHAISLHFMFYNFCKIHSTLRITPAMAAGISTKVWELSDIVALIPKAEPKKRGTYKKRISN
jgi:IS1 family transposase